MTTNTIADFPPDYAAHEMKDPLKDAKQEDGSTSSSGPEPQYIYYRVYDPNGAMPAKSAFNPADPFIGRITARSIPPPHTVASLTRCLVHAEQLKISAPACTATPSRNIRWAATTKWRFSGLASTGPSPRRPTPLYPPRKLQPRMVPMYYRLYTQVGEDPSKVSFKPHDPALGRIEKISVCPPHKPSNITRCIAEVEQNLKYRNAELYTHVAAHSSMSYMNFISLMKDDSIGSTEDQPVVLVRQYM
ncbi:hypothetical protein FB451DRAFT_1264599 [Mycena latifolia]|nr:hypothetical protein FB451DRAFT_1264599 [Mycena latifolia]